MLDPHWGNRTDQSTQVRAWLGSSALHTKLLNTWETSDDPDFRTWLEAAFSVLAENEAIGPVAR